MMMGSSYHVALSQVATEQRTTTTLVFVVVFIIIAQK
jgi:hypothetical protein